MFGKNKQAKEPGQLKVRKENYIGAKKFWAWGIQRVVRCRV